MPLTIYRHIEEVPPITSPVVTMGGFDGLHTGHRQIIQRIKEAAAEIHGESFVITFSPHPRLVVDPTYTSFRLLTTDEEKAELIEKAGIRHLLIQKFDHDFAALPPLAFIRQYLVQRIRLKKLIIGYNHRFGSKREGQLQLLQQEGLRGGFSVERIGPEMADLEPVSSTLIRESIMSGQIGQANKMLGYSYSIRGTVISGNRIGKTIGYPTANLQLNDSKKLVPPFGVYAVNVLYNNKMYSGMTNIGIRPSLNLNTPTIETHLFDFSEDLYDKPIRVVFIERIRDEIKFESLQRLQEQLSVDECTIRMILQKKKHD